MHTITTMSKYSSAGLSVQISLRSSPIKAYIVRRAVNATTALCSTILREQPTHIFHQLFLLLAPHEFCIATCSSALFLLSTITDLLGTELRLFSGLVGCSCTGCSGVDCCLDC